MLKTWKNHCQRTQKFHFRLTGITQQRLWLWWLDVVF